MVAAAPAGPRLPRGLGPPSAPGPESLEAFMARGGLAHASVSAFQAATQPIVGARVRWRLFSWGGESSSVGFESPLGRQPADIGRIRFVSESLRDADLSGVDAAGHPVVTCLSRFSSDDEPTFVRSDGVRAEAPGVGRSVTIEAIVWGVTAEGRAPTLWLADCAAAGAPVASGLYHLEHIDAMNLALDVEGGTFRVGVDGCDYRHAARGVAQVGGEGVVLSGDFTWPAEPSVANPVETVLLRPGPEGSLRATGVIGGAPFDQEWLPGGVCPDCGGGLGPSGQRSCESPYLGR